MNTWSILIIYTVVQSDCVNCIYVITLFLDDTDNMFDT